MEFNACVRSLELLLLCILVMLHQAQSLQCYTCLSIEDACQEPFDRTAVALVTCDPAKGQNACLTSVAHFTDGHGNRDTNRTRTMSKRECSNKFRKGMEACPELRAQSQSEGRNCYCFEDGCNTGRVMNTSNLLPRVPSAVVPLPPLPVFSHSLECYSCSVTVSEKDRAVNKPCAADPFEGAGIDTKICNETLGENACFKLVTYYTPVRESTNKEIVTTVYSRLCGTSDSNTCFTEAGGQQLQEFCYCNDKDLCNKGHVIQTSLVGLAICTLLGLLSL